VQINIQSFSFAMFAAFVMLAAGCKSSGLKGDPATADDAVASADVPEVDAEPSDISTRDQVAADPDVPADLDVPVDPDVTVVDLAVDHGSGADDSLIVADDGGEDAPPDIQPPDVGPPPPEGCVLGEFRPYFGNMHAHTSNSDGAGTPADAFAYARDTAKLDIQFVTDHLEQLYVIPCLMPDKDFPDCQQAATDATVSGTFLAGCGFEYGTSFGGVTGHNNVYFAAGLFPCLQAYFTEFYQSVVDDKSCIAQFNHPGDSFTHTWRNFEYHADVDQNLNLMEFNTGGDAWALFFQALDAGWHVSPLYDQDNHGADWGTKNDSRAGFFMTDLTAEALHMAMRDRRSFATTDKNSTIALKTADGCWMGSILQKVKSVTVTAEVADPDSGDGFIALEFWGPKMTQFRAVDCAGASTCSGSTTVQVSGPTFVLARALQSDGQYMVSAPIWMEP
jgi:hypothetical protein